MKSSETATTGRTYRVSLTLTNVVRLPRGAGGDWSRLDTEQLRVLDLVVHDFARAEIAKDSPSWFLSNSKTFQANGADQALGGGYVALRGTYSSIRSCLAGLVLCADMTVSCFLYGGSLIDVMWCAANYRNADAFLKDVREKGINKRSIGLIEDAIKGLMCRIIHLKHTKKIKCLGPPSNSEASSFLMGDKNVTVAEYFSLSCRDPVRGAAYCAILGPSKALKFPFLPTINVGSKSKPVLIPAELVEIRSGQTRWVFMKIVFFIVCFLIYSIRCKG